MPLEPLMLRMPHILAEPSTFSPPKTLFDAVDAELLDGDDDDDEPCMMPAQSSSSSRLLVSPPNSAADNTPLLLNPTISWNIPRTNYTIDIEVNTAIRFKEDDIFACLSKSIKKISKLPSTESIEGKWESATFDKVVLSMEPKEENIFEKEDDSETRLALAIVGKRGLYGYFERTKKFFAIRYGVRDDDTPSARRYLAFGKVKKGLWRSCSGDGIQYLQNGEIREKLMPF